jgi:hypothetical protein
MAMGWQPQSQRIETPFNKVKLSGLLLKTLKSLLFFCYQRLLCDFPTEILIPIFFQDSL